MDEWKYLDLIEELPDSESIHCDTRDFYVIAGKETQKEAIKFIRRNKSTVNQCSFSKEEIIPLLKELETASGGRHGWRCLTLTSIYCWWLKYIRFCKLSDGKYFCYTISRDIIIPLYRDRLKAEFVNKEYCYAH